LPNATMTSLKPLQGKSYHEDLMWPMVYQRKMLGLTCQQVACNLNLHSSTLWRTVKRFEEGSSIDEKKNEGPHKLTELEEFAIMEIVLEMDNDLEMYKMNICYWSSDS